MVMNTDLVFMYQGKVSVLGFNITGLMNTDLVFMYQGKVSVLGFNITGGNEYRLGIYVSR
jgi:hypothetical protein